MKSKFFSFLIAVILVVFIGCKFLMQNGGSSGEKAPLISGIQTNGSDFSSKDLEGKFIVLDFWGSWCLPCRAVLSELIELQKMNNGSYEIVSIALEKRKGAGKNAAKRLGFNWKYQIEEVSKFVAFNGTARDYGVTDIPATFLIDKEGKNLGQKSVSEIKAIILN